MNGSVVVTGAANGIGGAIASVLAESGWQVVALDSDAEALERLGEQLPQVAGVTGDVRDPAAHAEAADRAAALAPLTGWVNNAGIVRLGLLHEMDPATIDLVLDVNLGGVVLGCRQALRSYLSSGIPGMIVNISSVHSRAGFPGYSAYDAAKGGVDALTRHVCVEYGHLGIRCNAVAPGAVDTAIVATGTAATGHPSADDELEATRSLSPMHRISPPDEIAGIVAFLLSPVATSINGHVLFADNGLTARSFGFRPDPAVTFPASGRS